MEDVAPATFEIFTDSHSDHALQWQIEDQQNQTRTCMACVVENLEDGDLLMIKKKAVLGQLLRVLSSQADATTHLLKADMRVTAHLLLSLINGLTGLDDTFVSTAAEAIVQLVNLMRSEHVVCCILDAVTQKCLKMCNFKRSVPMLSVVGRLLHDIPALAVQLITGYGSLLDYVAAALAYPSPDVQAAAAYIGVHVYSGCGAGSRPVPRPLTARLVPTLLAALTGAGAGSAISSTPAASQLQVNALGLLRLMVEDPSVTELFFSPAPRPGPSAVTLGLKRALLSRENLLQVAAVQCINTMIKDNTRGQHFADLLLLEDVAEFLFEALSTTNELLIGSIFTSLLLFTGNGTFFKKCHAVYGIEAIMRAVEQALKFRSSDVIQQGLALLKIVLNCQPPTIRIFSNVGLSSQCFRLVAEGVASADRRVSLAATETFSALLSPLHLPSPLPYRDIIDTMLVLIKHTESQQLHSQASMNRHKMIRAKRKHQAVKSQRVQDRLLANVTALKQGCALAKHCLQNPALNTEAFLRPAQSVADPKSTEPKSTGADMTSLGTTADQPPAKLDDLIEFLRGSVADHFIPTIMPMLVDIEDGAVFLGLFSSINALWDISPVPMDVLGQRLVETGFLRLCLSVRDKFSDEVREEVDDCMSRLYLLSLTDRSGDVRKQAAAYLKQGLQGLNGVGVDVVSVLHQNSADPPDPHLAAAQGAVLSLLHLAYTNNDRDVAPAPAVLGGMSAFLLLHQDSLHHLPTALLPQIVTLFVLSWTSVSVPGPDGDVPACDGSDPARAGLVLGRLLSRVVAPAVWCDVRQPALLQWVFSHPELAARLGSSVLKFWISSGDVAVMQTAFENPLCLEAMLDDLSSFEGEPFHRMVGAISNILPEADPGSPLISLLRVRVPAILQSQLLSESGTAPRSDQVVELLKLLVELKLSDYNRPLSESDIKLAFHVCRLLNQCEDNSELDLEKAAFEFLVCMLTQSINQKDNRVGCMVLSQSSLLGRLERTLRREPRPAAVTLTALLIQQQHRFNLPVHHVIRLEERALLPSTTRADNGALRTALFSLWSAYLEAYNSPGGSTGLLELSLPGSGPGRAVDDDRHCPTVSLTTLRLLVIDTLHGLIQGLPHLQVAAVDCHRALLTCRRVEEKPSLIRDHVINHPWINFVLQLLQTNDANSGRLPQPAFDFCLQLFEAGGQHHSDVLNEMLLRHVLSVKDSDISTISPQYCKALKRLSQQVPIVGINHRDLDHKIELLTHRATVQGETFLKPTWSKHGNCLILTKTST